MKCEVGCGGEGDANVSACFAGDASRMSAAKKFRRRGDCRHVGVCDPREIRHEDLAACAVSPAGARSGTLAKASVRVGARRRRRAVPGTDGRPRPRAPVPARNAHADYPVQKLLCVRAVLDQARERARACASSVETSHARARSPARLPSARYDRKPRRRRPIEPGRARVRVVRPSRRGPNASTCDSRTRACAQFPAGTRAVRLDRAKNAGFERRVGSTYLRRSLEREMHDRRAVRAVCSGASSRSTDD